MDYLLHLVVVASVYAIAAIGLDLFAGRTGLLSACHAALMGLGAYTSAVAASRLDWPWLATVALGALVAALTAPVVGLVSLRARGDYFVLATLALQAVFANTANSWDAITGGPFGLRGIPRPVLFGLEVRSVGDFACLTLLALGLVMAALQWLERSAFLPALRGGRDDAELAIASGKDWRSLRLEAYALGGALAGMAGVMLAHYVTFIDAETFSLEESVFLLSIVLVGGLDRVGGPVVGALILTLIPEVLRAVVPALATGPYLRTGLAGAALVAVVLWQPLGVVGRFSLVRPRYE